MGIWVFKKFYCEVSLLLEMFSNCRLKLREEGRRGIGNKLEACYLMWNVVVI